MNMIDALTAVALEATVNRTRTVADGASAKALRPRRRMRWQGTLIGKRPQR